MITPSLAAQHSRTLGLQGVEDQHLLRFFNARVAVIGCGGLGSGFLPQIVAMGCRHLALCDGDHVSISNLPRQPLYGPCDLGAPKAEVAKKHLQALAPDARIEMLTEYATASLLRDICSRVDLVADCSDNFATRYAISDAAKEFNIPVVYGAVEEYRGQLTIFHGKKGVGIEELFGEQPIDHEEKPAIFPPAVHTVGTLMAGEAFYYLTETGNPLDGELLTIDFLTHTTHRLKIG